MIKKNLIKTMAMLLFIAFMLSSCKNQDVSLNKHKVIFDTDTAADDAMALIMAAKAPNIELKAVTVLAGNVSLEQGSKNALMSLEVAGRSDVLVYLGSDISFSGKKIKPFSVFGDDGMGDQDLIHPTKSYSEKNGIDIIIETVKENPFEIEIMATGPLTNVAKAIQKDPETMSKVKRIWSMGSGGTKYLGNATPVSEFNVNTDIEAYQYVLKSGIPMTIVGNDVCNIKEVMLSEKELKTLEKNGKCGAFLSKALTVFINTCSDSTGYTSVCDPVTVAAMVWEDFSKEIKICDAEAVLDEGIAKGQVVFYIEGTAYDIVERDFNYHIEVVSDLKTKNYLHNVCKLISDK